MQIDLPQNNSHKNRSGTAANWIRDLAETEADMIYKGTADIAATNDHRKIVEAATKEFMLQLKEEFLACSDLFNAYRGGAQVANAIKVFQVANTAADFILFRNTLKLVVANPALGVINLSFSSRTAMVTKSINPGKKREGVDLIAQLYPFNELVWTYHGERINIPALVRFMFTDFVKSSALF